MGDFSCHFSPSQATHRILHNLSICCDCSHNGSYFNLNHEETLLTFSVQLTRAVVTSLLLILLLLCYSSLRVLGRTIINCTATCVIPWIIFFSLCILRSLTIAVFIGIILGNHYDDSTTINQIGFIIINVLQPIALLVTCCALNHEWHYRSPDYVDNPPVVPNEGSWALKLRHLVCRATVIFICQAIVTILLLIAIEILFEVKTAKKGPPLLLVYVWLIAMLVQRLTVCVMGILVCTQQHNRPTVLAKVLLMLGLLFLILDDLPNSLLATGDFCTDPCYIPHHRLNVYDICQMMGLTGTILILLFIRDQYNRVEEECKHHLLWDLERLLDVNTQERNDLLIK